MSDDGAIVGFRSAFEAVARASAAILMLLTHHKPCVVVGEQAEQVMDGDDRKGRWLASRDLRGSRDDADTSLHRHIPSCS